MKSNLMSQWDLPNGDPTANAGSFSRDPAETLFGNTSLVGTKQSAYN
ncbi:MAG: hypothetical protein KAQ79_09610 [Cyclobacteriaceae bacterium]|nr:hypothetical protein [Cyclobacteriaceae bacterium]